MRSLLVLVIVALPGLAAAFPTNNLLVNPSFEEPDVAPGTAQVFEGSIEGWTDLSFCGIEVQDNCCGAPSHGSQHVELDADNCTSAISQTVPTQPGAKYVLSFDFSPRPSVVDNRVIVSWNGSQVFDLSEISPPGGDVNWQHHSAVVTATGTTSTVEFAGADSPDGVGSYLDNLPEPGRSTALLAGLAMLWVLSVRRGKSHVGARPR